MSKRWTVRAATLSPLLAMLAAGPIWAATPDLGTASLPDSVSFTRSDLPQPPHLEIDGSMPDEALAIPADAAAPDGAAPLTAAVDARQVECVAKVIMHEAGYEPHKGQVAVAQVIRARMKKGGQFPEGACAVIRQPGQFFNVDAYNPPRADGRWDQAVEIARETLAGEGDDVAPGALFFHAAASRGAFVGSRTRVAQIGGHVFFR